MQQTINIGEAIMSEKLSEYIGNIKCDQCGHKFYKGIKGEKPTCPSCGGRLLVKEIDDTRLIDD